MGCCKKIKNIAIGYTNLARGVKYEFTDDRVRACQKCDWRYWIGRTLWCRVCKCFIPAKARVENEKCPKGFWKS